jgi:DNA topoisomerase-1
MRKNGSSAPPEALAREAGLTYASDDEPGIRRERAGTGFRYRLPGGRILRDAAERRRIRALAIPPAWTDVWICPSASGHIQATGRDAKGRKQYKYHAQWREVRDADKYDRMLEFARLLPRIRARLSADMARRGITRERVLATVASLLDRTLIRVGNDEYAKENASYGLTTLLDRHLEVKGEELRFQFKGKSGKSWKLAIRDRRIARIVRGCQELPGQRLFQYTDDAGTIRTVTSTDVNAYLREIGGELVSTKDFRTWAGTVLAAMALSAVGPYRHATHAKQNVRRAVEAVATRLGNTPTVCRKCYVHPEIVACYLEGRLPRVAAGRRNGNGKALGPEEAAVLALLRRRLSRGKGRRRRRAAGPGVALRAASRLETPLAVK